MNKAITHEGVRLILTSKGLQYVIPPTFSGDDLLKWKKEHLKTALELLTLKKK